MNKITEQGFTLVELLVTIIIIGILAALGLPTYLNQINKARLSEARIAVGQVNTAQQAYFVENNEFSNDFEKLGVGIQETSNYEYSLTTDEVTSAIITASPKRNGLSGFAGKAFLTTLPQGSVRVDVISCEGSPNAVPQLNTTTTCPLQ